MQDINVLETLASDQKVLPEIIEDLDRKLQDHFGSKLVVEPALTRSLVSFQGNKTRPVYRWYKFKEAFSVSLVEYLFGRYGVGDGVILDPFAGSGTSLFVASALGIDAEGIELLPIGQEIIAIRRLLDSEFNEEDFQVLENWAAVPVWRQMKTEVELPELRITRGAYSDETKEAIEKYLTAAQHENARVQAVLRFALLCVLEIISYTRKDGQYLRWDYRSDRRQGKKSFNKGAIPGFEQAISEKLKEIIADVTEPVKQLSFFERKGHPGNIELHKGSCLEVMPTLNGDRYDAIITSPPYCNRYDYTRTYALELALLGIGEKDLVNLRQEMLSCTVENRAKDLLKINPLWKKPIAIADQQELLQTILQYLEVLKSLKALNNNGIPRMVRGYFYETACVIMESARVLKNGALLFMVNDNVRYAGISISVDLILSDFAERMGFKVENVLVLPNGKGNSSQQMGEHGRKELRKCVYVWRKE